MRSRRAFLLLAAALPMTVSGCGWHPLYADPQSGPADVRLRAVRVEPISERIGQHLELRLRNLMNPTGIRTRQRYVLRTTLAVSRQSLGIQSQGLTTRAKLDVYATFALAELRTGRTLLSNTVHVADGFDVSPDQYATVVAEDDARRRAVAELSREIVTRLTLYLQRHSAGATEPG